MTRHKLGIIVPYRDRYEQLEEFKKLIGYYLKSTSINYELIIVEQDNSQLFNRGMLLNIGFTYAEKMMCDYVVFHDIDMIPIDVKYSYSKKPIHLATDFVKSRKMKRVLFDEYFGGVTIFPIEDFKKINGYSNKYWGWGYEDDDLLYRCKKNGIQLNTLKIKNQGNHIHTLKFNGINSYIRGKNIFNLNKATTIFMSFYPDELTCDPDKKADSFTIFSIPGYDTSISYNSFSRYNFCTFDREKNALYVNSNIKTNYMTNICVTIDKYGGQINVYQDGENIGTIDFDDVLMEYSKEEYFYLGVANPNRSGSENYFRGYINQFAVFSQLLEDDEIKEISKNKKNFLDEDFGNYISSHKVQLYYDARIIDDYLLTDLSKKRNHGEIINCEITHVEPKEFKTIKVPYRRKSKFALLPHEENGFIDNAWKTEFTRWNQLRFYNEVLKNDELIKNDGLSDLSFIEHGKYINDKITRIVVGI